jgi:hypothetical protein
MDNAAAEWRRALQEAADRFSERYQVLGGEGGWLGRVKDPGPIWDTNNGGAWVQHFDSGAICQQEGGGIFEIHGAIYEKWVRLGAGRYGWPVTDELPTPDGKGAFSHLSQGGSIYWSRDTPAFEVHGAIRDRWAQLGWEQGYLGYPISDELDNPDNAVTGRGDRYSRFQGGFISWRVGEGAHEHRNNAQKTFTVESMRIASLRSGHRDTDVLSMQVSVQGRPVEPDPLVVVLGDFGVGGPYAINRTVSFTADDPSEEVVLSFIIANNAGGDTEELREALRNGFKALVATGGTAVGAAVGGAIGSAGGPIGAALGALIGAVAGVLAPIMFADCDGPVVVDTIHMSAATLNDVVFAGPRSESKDYPGIDSPAGCGDNSFYGVSWVIS